MSEKNTPYTPQRIAKAPTPNIKVSVSIPVYEHFHAQFGYSFGKMMLFTGVTLVADGIVDVLTNMIEGTYLHRARNDLAIQAMKIDATHILWLDADMKFPQDALLRLLGHGKPIVGANYSHRRFPIHHVAFKTVGEGNDRGADVMCRTTDESTGLEEVEGIGFGMLLMETAILTKIPFPWFTLQDGVGEDLAFCRRAREAGYKIYVDHDLSKEMVHWGPMGWTCAHAEEWLENEWNQRRKVLDAQGQVVAPSAVPAVEGIAVDTPAKSAA